MQEPFPPWLPGEGRQAPTVTEGNPQLCGHQETAAEPKISCCWLLPHCDPSKCCSLLLVLTFPAAVVQGITKHLLLLWGPLGLGTAAAHGGLHPSHLGHHSVRSASHQGPGLLPGAAGLGSVAALPIPAPPRPVCPAEACTSGNLLAGSPSLVRRQAAAA